MYEDTGEAPKALLAKPEVPPHLSITWDAFWALSGDRQMSMGGPLPIPFMAIDRYATRFGVADGDEFARFLTLLKRMDSAYLEWAAEKARQNQT